MNKRISVLWAAIVIAFPIYATEAVTVDDFRLEEVEVTAQKAQMQSDAFRLVSQLTHEEIEALPIYSVADILAHLPGLDVRSRGVSSAQSDLSMHGGTFDQVLVMLNGISLQDAQTGQYALNIPISTELIERIEVLQGTAANLTGAFTGAINIVTRDAQTDCYDIQMQAGTNDYISPSFAASWARGDVHINASVDYTQSDGYYAPQPNTKEQIAIQNSDYRIANLFLQSRWRGLDIQTGAQYKDAGLGMAYGFGSQDQFDATRTMFVSARYNGRLRGAWSITAQMAYRGQYDRYEWHRGTPLNRHWSHNAHGGLQVHYASSIGRTTIGAECRNEYIRSTSMGEHNRLQATLSAEQQFLWQGLSASLGIAGHYNTMFGWHATGAASIGYAFLRSGSVYVTACRSVRMPTYTDMYYDAGFQLGSDSLKAENAWTISLGAQYTWNWQNAGQLHIAGSAYYRWGSNIIDWVYVPTDTKRPYHAMNQQKVDAFGAEIEVDYHYNTWLRELRVQYAYTHLSLDLDEAQSRYLDYLRHKVVVTLDHGIYVWNKGAIGACWSLRYQDRLGQYNDTEGDVHSFRPVLLLDGSLYAQLPYVRIAIDCQNMTNRHYYDYGGIIMPGAWVKASVKAHF